jgi:hypothetical protein
MTLAAQSSSPVQAPPDWLLQLSSQADEIAAFCNSHGEFLAALKNAIELVERNFPPQRKIEIRLEQDPEIRGEWLVIAVAVTGDVDAVLNDYDRCMLAWVSSLTPEALRFLCLTYDFV